MMAKRKLIEAAIPLTSINAACRADKDRKTGTIRNLHKWFAPMPLPAWRALLFANLVDDPDDEHERDRLLTIIDRLVASGGDIPDPQAVREARREIARSWPDGIPPVVDPFCGAGSTLIEAQRLGCETIGSDLNPVPVLITKVMTELLPRVADAPSMHKPDGKLHLNASSYDGVITDVLHYASVIEERAQARLRDFYLPSRDGNTTVAWLWCRTARCPNPACGVEAPLATSWTLSGKRGDERWIVPTVSNGRVEFDVAGPPAHKPAPPKVGRGANFVCVNCHAPIDEGYLAKEGRPGRIGLRLTSVIEANASDSRIYRAPRRDEEAFVLAIDPPENRPTTPLPENPRWFSPPLFGFSTHEGLYTARQMQVLAAFADEVAVLPEEIERDGGTPDQRDAIVALLGLCVGKLAQYASTQALLGPTTSTTRFQSGFTRADIPMNWDFCETNPFAEAGPSWRQTVTTALRALAFAPSGKGTVVQRDARNLAAEIRPPVVIATDPPYFGQIGYADLSDYFYFWLRRALRRSFRDLFSTIVTPKAGELVALPTRHGGSALEARRYFIDGFVETFRGIARVQSHEAPILVVYAYKEQNAKSHGEDIAPGWEAILEAIIAAGLAIVGTWPIHGTSSTRMISMGTNALATYVVLVCRPRLEVAPRTTRSDLTRLLRSEMGQAVAELQHANIAPVDLAQAVIGPGMEVFTRHSSVIENDGSRVGVAQALALINRTLGEILDEQEGDLDPDSRWAVTWYDEHAFGTASFGLADQLARAKGIAVDSLVEAGIVNSGGGKVALIARDALSGQWDPATDRRATAWEAVQYLVRALDEGGERAAAELYARLARLADPARELAYRLFQIADKRGRTDEAIAYNGLVTSWSEIARLADDLPRTATEALF
jgi:putative DNA methylase